jgi:hypothetical protein
MPSGEGMWLSRMRENLTSGSLGERWKRGGPPALCGFRAGALQNATTNGLVGTQPEITCYRASALPDRAIASCVVNAQVGEGVSVAFVYYLSRRSGSLFCGQTATMTSSMAGKGREAL